MRAYNWVQLLSIAFLLIILSACSKEEDPIDNTNPNNNNNTGGNGNNNGGVNITDYSQYTVQELLDLGVSIGKILEYHEVSDLYGKQYLGGYIAYFDEVNGEGFVAAFENHPEKLTWNQAMTQYPQTNLWVLPNPEEMIYVFRNLIPTTNIDFTIFNYWSSLEYSPSQSFIVSFNMSQLSIQQYMDSPLGRVKNKTEFNFVRPIKRFNTSSNTDPAPNNPGARLTVQQLIDAGVSIPDIKEVYGYQSYDIVGNKYLDGMIVYVNVGGDGIIYNGTVMAFQNYQDELNWDDAMALFPSGGWSMATANDFSYMYLSVTVNTNTHPSWSYPSGYFWTPQDGTDQWNNEAVAFYPSSNTRIDDAWKSSVYKIRLVRYF